jgi:endonuclease IV
MRVGIKMGPVNSEEYVGKISFDADFFEVYARKGYDCDFLLKYNKPVMVHIPHSGDQVNFADSQKKEINLQNLDWALKLANKFKSQVIVFHPGRVESEFCSIENAINFIKEHHDKRLHVENVPLKGKRFKSIGGSFEDIKRIMQEADVGFCLDMAHAIEYAKAAGLEAAPFIKKMLSLKPDYFHLTDTPLEEDTKTPHLNLGEGKLDLKLMKSLLPNNALIALETPGDAKKQKKEIAFMKKI